jgi:4-hydroxybenzoate polyprenyltransferase
VDRDRMHPRKRFRSIASGRLPAPLAVVAGVVFLGGSVVGNFALNLYFGLVLFAYGMLALS